MAKQKTEVGVTDAQPAAAGLSDEGRCRAAFAQQGRAASEADALTSEEMTTFAALVAEDGTPLHLDAAGNPVRHGDQAAVRLAVNFGQRFAALWSAVLARRAESREPKVEN